MIYVISRRNNNNIPSEATCVYIGRGRGGVAGIFGNPFVIGRDGDRDEVINKFRKYFEARLEQDQAVREAFDELLHHARAGDLYLVCWCAPLSCHGDVIRDMLLAKIQSGE